MVGSLVLRLGITLGDRLDAFFIQKLGVSQFSVTDSFFKGLVEVKLVPSEEIRRM